MKLIYLLGFFCITVIAFGQKRDTVFCDCRLAKTIVLTSTKKIGPVITPPGPGEKQEISEQRQKTKFAFEKEHHSAWYKLVINTSGHLSFDIVPVKKDDDYDFMLFRAEDSSFCTTLHKNKAKPLRACISRDREEVEGKTGLSFKSGKEFVKEGVGDAYVQPVYVQKGEIYYLVLDNVYDQGEGHTIRFYFEEPVMLKGVVTDENSRPVKADVALTNAAGDTVSVAKTLADGSYQFNTYMRRNLNYVLSFYNDSSFTFSKNVALKDTVTLKNIRMVLPRLRKGARYPIGSINFYPGQDVYLPSAMPSINNLYKLLSKNKTLRIQIEGHTNGCAPDVQKLSENRALNIMKSLVAKGIAETRIKTLGKGCKEMLFPNWTDATPEQQEANRRVEVLVLEY